MKKITAFKCSDGVIEECVDRAIAREIGWHLKKNTAHDANFNTLLAIERQGNSNKVAYGRL